MGVLASEWTKTRSLRSTWVLAGAALVVTVAVSLLGIAGSADEWRSGLPTDLDPVGNSLKGILVGQIVLAMLGAQTISAEFSTGQISSTLAITPRRGMLLLAKAISSGAVAAVTAAVTVACSFLTGHAAMTASGLPARSLGDPGTLQALLNAAVYLVLISLVGLALGTITRSSSGALAVIVTIALLVPALAPGLPGIIGDVAGTFWPTTAGQSSYTTGGSILPAVGIGIMGVFTLWSLVAATVVFRRRDA